MFLTLLLCPLTKNPQTEGLQLQIRDLEIRELSCRLLRRPTAPDYSAQDTEISTVHMTDHIRHLASIFVNKFRCIWSEFAAHN